MSTTRPQPHADSWTLSGQVPIEDPLGNETEGAFSAPQKSYGVDFAVADLVDRLNAETIFVPPFQRDYVWSLEDASRFVESLLLNLPVPGIFLAREFEADRLLIIDGHQRLRSLQFFLNGTFGPTSEPFRLRGVQQRFEGKGYSDLSFRERKDLDTALIHATIVHQEDPLGANSSVYHIFERLNTGGRELTGQEIRSALYHGELRKLLSDLNENEHWRAIFGPNDPRMRDQELILRFLALLFYRDEYAPPMKDFLNRYMAINRNLTVQSAQAIKSSFREPMALVYDALGKNAFKPGDQINAAVFDSVMVGVATALQNELPLDAEQVQRAYQHLLKDNDYQAAYQQSTANKSSVETRLQRSIDAFSKTLS